MVLQPTPQPPPKVALSFKKRRFRFYPFKQKSLSLLPNLFTLGNAFFGFSSLIFVTKEAFIAGAYAILLGGLMDMLDGRLARYAGSTSDLGLQLDSLCDAISFCVAPAFLMYFWQLKNLGLLGFAACAFFLLTGIFRLARFNLTHDAQTIYFLGIPTPLAAGTLVVFFLNFASHPFSRLQILLLFMLTLTLSILMVSSFKFPTLKHLKKQWCALGTLAALAFFMIFGLTKVGLIVIIGYFLFAFEENARLIFTHKYPKKHSN